MSSLNPVKGIRRLDDRIDLRPLMADLGAPVVASANRVVASTAMIVGAYTIANAAPADGQARNVTCTVTPTSTIDTMGTLVVTGTNVDGTVITETLTPASGLVSGTKAFKTVTGVVGVGWVAVAGADLITVGFGNLIGLPSAVSRLMAGATDVFLTILGNVVVAATVAWDVDEPEKNTLDASAATYNGTKRLVAMVVGS